MTLDRWSVVPASPQLGLEELNALLHRYCLSLTSSEWDSEDLVQDTWLKALEYTQDRSHPNPEALLLRVAKNTWIDRARREQLYRRILDEKLEQRPMEEAANEAGRFQLELAFHWLQQQLSPLQRTVLLLRDVFDYSVSETAVMLRTTDGAVKAALHRAHKVLKSKHWADEELALIMPEDEDAVLNLQALAEAYQSGDVEAVVRLMQGNTDEVSAIGIMAPVQMQSISSTNNLDMRMSA
ncbi:hypothetical protein JCM10914A_01310 [Paenibacillus sp. JCM 10914]